MDHPPRKTDDQLREEVARLRAENEHLRSEVRRLRGEGTPVESRPHTPWGAPLLFRFLGGLCYLAFVAFVLSAVTTVAFGPMFLAVLAGAAFCTGLALFWMTRWAMREDGRPRQFSLGSLFFLTTFVAIYLAAVRWLVVNLRWPSSSGPPAADEQSRLFIGVGIGCLFLAAISIPIVLGMAEALVWFGVWLVRRPVLRRWLSRRGRQAQGP
jgi:hypothetical protein